MVDVELRTRDGRLHGVLKGLLLEIRQGDRLYIYDLLESLVQRRPVYTLQILTAVRAVPNEGFTDPSR